MAQAPRDLSDLQLARRIRMNTPIRVILAPIFLTGAAFTFVACGNGGGSTVIKAAPPTVAGAKIAACASTKLSAQGKTYQGSDSTVCRLVSGKWKDESVTPLFSAVKIGKQIGVFQTAAFTVTYKNVDGEAVALKEISEQNQQRDAHEIYSFLTRVCRPIAKTAFARSHVSGDVRFRLKTSNATWAQPTLQGSDGNIREDDLSDEPFGGKVGAAPAPELALAAPAPEKNVPAAPASPIPKRPAPANYSLPTGFHTQLDFEMLINGKTRTIRLADEVEALWSGTIEKLAKPSEEQLGFCNQLTQRVGENFGLTKGRDCTSRTAANNANHDRESALGEAKNSSGTGLMKPGGSKSTEALKISDEEMFELVKPVCGST